MNVLTEHRSIKRTARGYQFLREQVITIEPHEMTGEEAQQYLALVADEAAERAPAPTAESAPSEERFTLDTDEGDHV